MLTEVATKISDARAKRSMLIPKLRTPPASAATAPVLTGAVQRWGAALLAASVLSSTPFTPPAFAATPTATELSRISEGLARIDYLLDNWDKLTTVCKGTPDELESKQTVKIVKTDLVARAAPSRR